MPTRIREKSLSLLSLLNLNDAARSCIKIMAGHEWWINKHSKACMAAAPALLLGCHGHSFRLYGRSTLPVIQFRWLLYDLSLWWSGVSQCLIGDHWITDDASPNMPTCMQYFAPNPTKWHRPGPADIFSVCDASPTMHAEHASLEFIQTAMDGKGERRAKGWRSWWAALYPLSQDPGSTHVCSMSACLHCSSEAKAYAETEGRYCC